MTIDNYSAASDMMTALQNKDISPVELTEMHIDRIKA
jgi:hypothetical protein